MVKVRLIEGASNGDISFYMSNHYADYEVDSVAGNLIEAQKNLLKYYRLSAIIDSELDYYDNIIDIKEMHKRMIYNSIYDQINMNTFNFVNAAFDNLLFRYPTQNEFNNSYFMIEDNQPFTIFGYSGSNKLDFTNLICDSREFYEGIIQWTYLTMLARIPTSIERDFLMNDFYITTDFQKLQRFIMTTDEYAHF
jgi:ABC-type multidrug transport system fused ATPase/permease subunit